MSTLKQKAEAILTEKNAKILPQNIKKGVTVFNIEGILDTEQPASLDDYINIHPTDDNKSIIKQLPEIDLSNITDISNLFYSFGLSTLPNMDFSNVTNMNSCFKQMRYLKNIQNNINSVQCEDFNYMFEDCMELNNPNLQINVNKFRCLDSMFSQNSSMITSPQLLNFEQSLLRDDYLYVNYVFNSCTNLVNIPQFITQEYTLEEIQTMRHIYGMSNIIAGCVKLTKQSVLNVIGLIKYTHPEYYSGKTLKDLGLSPAQYQLVENEFSEMKQNYNYLEDWTSGFEDYVEIIPEDKLYANSTNTIAINNFSEFVTKYIINESTTSMDNEYTLTEYLYNTNTIITTDLTELFKSRLLHPESLGSLFVTNNYYGHWLLYVNPENVHFENNSLQFVTDNYMVTLHISDEFRTSIDLDKSNIFQFSVVSSYMDGDTSVEHYYNNISFTISNNEFSIFDKFNSYNNTFSILCNNNDLTEWINEPNLEIRFEYLCSDDADNNITQSINFDINQRLYQFEIE